MLFNSCISACDKGGQWQSALQVLETMQDCLVDCDLITCNACLSALSKAGHSSSVGTNLKWEWEFSEVMVVAFFPVWLCAFCSMRAAINAGTLVAVAVLVA